MLLLFVFFCQAYPQHLYEVFFICIIIHAKVGAECMKKGLTSTCHRFFTNLSNPTRLAALEQLMNRPMSVNEIAEALGQEQSMVSHNLKPLIECNFIFGKRQGKRRVYSVNHETVDILFRAVENHAEKFCPSGGKCLKGGN